MSLRLKFKNCKIEVIKNTYYSFLPDEINCKIPPDLCKKSINSIFKGTFKFDCLEDN